MKELAKSIRAYQDEADARVLTYLTYLPCCDGYFEQNRHLYPSFR